MVEGPWSDSEAEYKYRDGAEQAPKRICTRIRLGGSRAWLSVA